MGMRTGAGLTHAAEADSAFLVDPLTGLPYGAGNPMPVAATFSGTVTASTEYTEDAAAPANPVGGSLALVRRDTLTAAEVSADGDWVAAKGTSKGQLHVFDLDALAELVLIKNAAADTTTPVPVFATGREWEFVAASSVDNPLGAAGAVGDTLDSLIVVPLTTSPGEVKIKDGTAGTYRTIFLGGATSVGDLKPFEIGLSLKSLVAGGWIINTGANVQVFAAGDFT